MDILIIMVVGDVAGRWAVPESWRPAIGCAQTACTVALIVAMGLGFGMTPGFLADLARLGAQSLVICLAAMACSIACVWVLTRVVLADEARRPARRREQGAAEAARGATRPWWPDPLVLGTLAALVAGVALGACFPKAPLLRTFTEASDALLYVLMALVGVSVGMHRGLLSSVRAYHVKALVIPAGTIVGSLAGGVLAAMACGLPVRAGAAIASGLGWYSLAGVQIGQLVGAELGSIAFLANLMRELLSFFSIPWLAAHLNAFTCIAAGAATSEDTTLPMMIRYTDERCVVLSVVNGVLCSAAVPVLIACCLG